MGCYVHSFTVLKMKMLNCWTEKKISKLPLTNGILKAFTRQMLAVYQLFSAQASDLMVWCCFFPQDYITMDITQHARDVIHIVELASSMDEKLTPLKVCDAWLGKGPAKQRKMIKLTSLSRLEVESVIIHLLLHGYFRYFITDFKA